MRFFGREKELEELEKIRNASKRTAHFTVVTGRRRVGKTELLEKAFRDGEMPYLYLLVSNRAEKELCGIFQSEAERVIGTPFLGKAEHVSQILEILMKAAQEHPLTLVMDEFQEFDRINPAIFAEIQGVWDRLHKTAKINLVVCGSVNRLMTKIFFDDSQPLYGRNTGSMRIDPFPTSVLKEIFAEHCPNYDPRDLLTLWTLTGGVARYVELFMDAGAFTREEMLKKVYSLSSSYILEGESILSSEFGKDHGVYFSILSSIAAGHTSYAEIRNDIGFDVGGQLTRLERVYGLIRKKQPFGDAPSTKNCLYQIDDCFFRFWFRFVYKYQHLVEQKLFDELLQIGIRDLDTFSGLALEQYFQAKFFEEHRYTRIGGWWDRKGENEIDLVCENELTDTLDFYEVKTEASRFSPHDLEAKTRVFENKHPIRAKHSQHMGLSIEDM